MPIVGAIVKRALHLKSRIKLQPPLSPIKQQEYTLRKLLRQAAGTAFGKHYRFKTMVQADDVIAAFRAAVPVHDYNKIYDAWWHRTLNEEPNVCWPGKIKYFALSSGTTGSPSKHIPVTNAMLRSIRRVGLRMLMSSTYHNNDESLYEKGMMMLGGSTDLTERGGFEVGDLSGINASKLPFWLRRFYKPGTKISRMRNWHERLEEIAKEAPNWDIGFVMGIPAWVQLMIEKIIAYHGARHIHEIWPNFQVYVTGGVAFAPYRNSFERLLGKPVTFLDSYLASEGFIAFQDRTDTNAMQLQLDNGIFLEFIPFDEANFHPDGNPTDNPVTFTIDQVEEGVDYALLLTTCAGAWRYLIGDTVRFTNKQRNEIVITGRTKHFLSICGEHLSVDNMNQAIELVEKDLHIDIREFTVSGIKHGNFFAHKWYIGCEPMAPSDLVREKLDHYLKQLNDDYATERSSVLDIAVTTIPTHIFYKWHDEKGKMGGQSKFPRVMQQSQFEMWQAFVDKHVAP